MGWRRHYPSKWLKVDDLGDRSEAIVTIKSVAAEMVGQGVEASEKLVIQFSEFSKPMVCNVTACAMLESIAGTDDESRWIGLRVRLKGESIIFRGRAHQVLRIYPASPSAGTRRSASVAASTHPAVDDADGEFDEVQF